jgi:acetoin utilization deacetylase AcuC-like enzyme
MSDRKTIKHNFPLSDFEEEQAFLTSNHAEGWRLFSIKGKKYTFQKCDKEGFVYQIDFNPDECQKDEYIQLYTDFGWQFVAERDGRFYFCKSGRSEDESMIFSDS